MKKLLGKIRKSYVNVLVFLGFLACGIAPAEPAHAVAFQQAFENLKTLSEAAGPAIKALFLVCGLFFLGMGVFKWVQASKREEPKGPALTMVLAGVLLLGIWTFASQLAETMGLSVDASF